MTDVFRGTIGHEKQKGLLQRQLANGQVAHAYIFSGPKHIGKTRIAEQFGAALLDVSYEHLSANPNYTSVQLPIDKKTGERKQLIPVDAIRDLNEWVRLSAFGDGYKVAIIHDANRLSGAAQNAFLKTLEEPRKKTVLILVTSVAEQLLKTVRSRSVEIPFSLVPDHLMIQTEGRNDMVKTYSFGRPGVMVALRDQEGQEELRTSLKELASLLTGSVAARIRASGVLAKEKDRHALLEQLELLEYMARQHLLQKVGAVKAERDLAPFFQGMHIERLLIALQEVKQQIQNNGSVNLSLEHIIIHS